MIVGNQRIGLFIRYVCAVCQSQTRVDCAPSVQASYSNTVSHVATCYLIVSHSFGQVWWGNKPILAQGDVSGVAGVNSYSSHHPRKLFVSGLRKIFTQAEVDLRRAKLERAFRNYGGDRGVDVIVPTNTTYAFVETESERLADLALQEMAGEYRLNRARRSRHEALQEERAAAEAAKLGGGVAKEDSAW